MRSISPIIATILIIVITVAIAGLTYAFLSGLFSGLTSSTSNQVSRQSQYISFSITNSYCSNNILYISIYNNGNIPIIINNNTVLTINNGNNNIVSINGNNIICNNNNTILQGSTDTCYINNSLCIYNPSNNNNPQITLDYQGVGNNNNLGNGYLVGYFTNPLPIIIYNTQNISTPTPFQQDIAICNGNPNVGNNFAYVDNVTLYNEINSNGSNILFYSNNGLLYSWYEGQENISTASCDVWWANLPNGIPANNNITIYMEINNNTNYYSQYYPYTGISAYWYCYSEGYTNMSTCPNYGLYDNGQYVFNFYDNFAGTSLNVNKWIDGNSIPSGASGYISVDNGITLEYSGSTSGAGGIWIYTKSTYTQSNPFIWETLENMYGSNSSDIRLRQYIRLSSANTSSDIADKEAYSWLHLAGGIDYGYFSNSNYVNQAPVNFQTSTTNLGFESFVVPAASSLYDYTFIDEQILNSSGFYWYQLSPSGVVLNSNSYTGSNNNTFVLLIQASQDPYTGTTQVNIGWTLVRAYPPNGVMPEIFIQ
ncbi:RNA-binding protein [Nanobdella aerobiophila]|uniref:RNA-binding protein n=1 Tax=Nanobdella aerobiophila TaxID=2586965 RepID=A0A915SFC6_9ARCH|nr:archaellin/type IV pilin N-terminal domain-containing protein [Nanobdella aerobiophila]BBL45314.1 RNA-binding protein [Nanobdella aerobiophila]